MKVILQRDVPKLGRDGEIVNVADGYARNYLLPRQIAVAATGGALKSYKAREEREKEREAGKRDSARTDAEKLEGLTLVILGKVGTGTKLYGSITAADVADAIKTEKGVTVDKRRVGLVDPIKTLGTYTVPVRLHSDVSVPVVVEVMTETDLQKRKAREASEAAAAAEAAIANPPAAAPAPAEEAKPAVSATAVAPGAAPATSDPAPVDAEPAEHSETVEPAA